MQKLTVTPTTSNNITPEDVISFLMLNQESGVSFNIDPEQDVERLTAIVNYLEERLDCELEIIFG